jgi:hypothetical protein
VDCNAYTFNKEKTMNKEDYNEIERRKKEGGLLWFIERKSDGKWFHFTFEEDIIQCEHCLSVLGKHSKDGWTDNPQEALGFLAKDKADNAAFGDFYTNEQVDNLILTEHEFVGGEEKI